MSRTRRIAPALVALLLLAVALATRWRLLGDPVVQIDEQYYNLVGGRMLQGLVPYVDIWDRKPIGLFLIFAACRFVYDSPLSYQLLGVASVTATAFLVFVLARRLASDLAALAVAALYLLWLPLLGGEAGQAPVFYNLPVAGAIAIILFARDRTAAATGDYRLPGMAAMLLFGVALQIKSSVVFEGLFAGLLLIALAFQAGRGLPRLAIDIVLWVGCALVPTVLVIAYYAGIGRFDDWLFANVTSITLRGQEKPFTVLMRLAILAATMLPIFGAVPLRRWLGARPTDADRRELLRLCDLWAAAALLGVVLFGTWYNHYGLPLVAPFALIAAPLGAVRLGRLYLAFLLVYSAAMGQLLVTYHHQSRGDGAVLAAAARAMAGQRNCAFVYDGMTALYDASHSCLPTTRVFPENIQSLNEVGATGVDQVAEVRRVMAGRPDRVMTMEPANDQENLAVRRALYGVLQRDYVELWRQPGTVRDFVVYGRAGSPGVAATRGEVTERQPPDATKGFSFGKTLVDPWKWLARHLWPF